MKRTLLLTCILLSGLGVRADDDTGPFLKLRAGGSILQDADLRGARGDISFKPGYRFDVAGGYSFNPTCSLELETGVIGNSVDEIGGRGTGAFDFDLYQVPILVNGIYKLPVDWPIRPYFGVGVGGVASVLDVSFRFGRFRANDSETDFTFGYQAFTGLAYPVSDDIDVGLIYKFTGTTDHDWDHYFETRGILSHSLMAAVRFRF